MASMPSHGTGERGIINGSPKGILPGVWQYHIVREILQKGACAFPVEFETAVVVRTSFREFMLSGIYDSVEERITYADDNGIP